MVAIFCAALIAAVFKGSHDPEPAPLSANNCHPLASSCHVATNCEIRSVYALPDPNILVYRRSRTKNSFPSVCFTRSKFTQGIKM